MTPNLRDDGRPAAWPTGAPQVPGGPAPTGLSLDALILAGGRSARLGGTAKAGVVVGHRTLLDHALDAAAQVGAQRTVVVGPPGTVAAPLLCVQEAPAFGGPAAGIAAGLSVLRADWVLVLACDLPRAPDVGAVLLSTLHTLLATPGAGLTDGLCLVDSGGQSQWLAGIYRRSALDRVVAELGGPDGLSGGSVSRLLGRLDLLVVADPGGVAADVDTWPDVERARLADLAESSARTRDRDLTMTTTKPAAPTGRTLPPEALDGWLAALAAELGVDPALVPTGAILDIARDVAYGVARPAAPLSTFLVGLAAGQRAAAGEDPVEALRDAARRTSDLAGGWADRASATPATPAMPASPVADRSV